MAMLRALSARATAARAVEAATRRALGLAQGTSSTPRAALLRLCSEHQQYSTRAGGLAPFQLASHFHASPATLLCQRALSGARAFSSSVTIAVPEMGDSITEGEIAAVVKAPGDAVGEDEVVIQVETDKVTIDIRSPGAGVVQEVLVSESDVVTVGQPVAKVELGAEAAQNAEAAPAAAAGEPAPQEEEEEAVAAHAVDAQEGHHHRVPSIRFPTKEERRERAVGHGAVAEPSAKAASVPIFRLGVDATWRDYQPNYDDHVKRRVISEREIESIMLGGAAD